MFQKLREMREEREEGFTLIELLVVILIIGILSAIAIPAFMNQRKSAVDSSVQSDIKNASTQVETLTVKSGATPKNLDGSPYQEGTTGATVTATTSGVTGSSEASITAIKVSDGTSLTITGNTFGYCIVGTNTGGDVAVDGIVFASKLGGFLPAGSTCVNGEAGTPSVESQRHEGNVFTMQGGNPTEIDYTLDFAYNAETNSVDYTLSFTGQPNGTGHFAMVNENGDQYSVEFTVVNGVVSTHNAPVQGPWGEPGTGPVTYAPTYGQLFHEDGRWLGF